ncbi:MAG: redoxin family protein [Gammaproteobacteria bacterium]|nr:redoxin family protein [Gammaproteobacteria bacterium]
MSRVLLVFGVALFGLMAGALFMAGRIAAVKKEPAAAGQPQFETMEAPALEANSHPSFSLMGLDGEMHDFDEFDGRHRLLNFWATWCAPCRREIPLLKEFQAEQGDDGILVIGIAVDIMEEVREYAEAAEFNYPILVGEMDAMAVAEQSGLQFHAMPFTMIVSANGEFLNAHFGELHRPDLDKVSDVLARLDAGEIDTDTAREALDL